MDRRTRRGIFDPLQDRVETIPKPPVRFGIASSAPDRRQPWHSFLWQTEAFLASISTMIPFEGRFRTIRDKADAR